MTEHPTSHEGRQPLAARPQERTRPRQEAPGPADDAAVAAPPHGRPHPGTGPVPAQPGPAAPPDDPEGPRTANAARGAARTARSASATRRAAD
ncbi:serine/threonine protein phosphatase, partial [Streptomyces thermolilacinus]